MNLHGWVTKASAPVLTLAVSTWTASVLAQTTPAAAPAPAPAPVIASPAFSLIQGLVGLLVVLALIFAAAWLLKKIGPRGRATGMVEVLGGASVGPRERVVVVRFGSETLLLGVAPGHVELLRVQSGEGSVPAAPDAPPFADRLRAAQEAA